MKLDSKKILTIGAGAVVGYLIFCKFMQKGAEKSLEGGAEAPSEGGGGGGFGGGGGGFSPMPILPIVTPVVAPVVTLPNTSQIARQDVAISNVQSGNSSIASGDASANVGRATPPPFTKPPVTDASGAPVVAIDRAKFTDFDGTDFDGNMNQDRIL